MKAIRYLATALVCAIVAIICFPAHAGSISGGRASFSAPRASPAPARSIGVQKAVPAPAPRPAPIAAAPKPAPTAAPTVRTNTYAAAPAPVVVHNTTGGGGGGFLSSFAGGAAGALVGNALSQPHGGTTVVQGAPPAAMVNANGEPIAAPAAMVVAEPSRSATAGAADAAMSIVVFLGILIAAAVAGYFLFRAYQMHQAKKAAAEANKLREIARELMPISVFVNLQKAFAAADMDRLRGLCSPDFLAFVETDLPNSPKPYTLTDVSATILGVDGLEASVRYRAKDTADGTTLNEVWHLEYIDGTWLVSGIQQTELRSVA